jgi:hypothetical protein
VGEKMLVVTGAAAKSPLKFNGWPNLMAYFNLEQPEISQHFETKIERPRQL